MNIWKLLFHNFRWKCSITYGLSLALQFTSFVNKVYLALNFTCVAETSNIFLATQVPQPLQEKCWSEFSIFVFKLHWLHALSEMTVVEAWVPVMDGSSSAILYFAWRQLKYQFNPIQSWSSVNPKMHLGGGGAVVYAPPPLCGFRPSLKKTFGNPYSTILVFFLTFLFVRHCVKN